VALVALVEPVALVAIVVLVALVALVEPVELDIILFRFARKYNIVANHIIIITTITTNIEPILSNLNLTKI